MRPASWTVLGVLAFAVAAGLLVGAFTRFSGEPEPAQGDPGFAAYEKARLAEARLSVVLGLGACFSLLGGAACMQRARRARAGP